MDLRDSLASILASEAAKTTFMTTSRIFTPSTQDPTAQTLQLQTKDTSFVFMLTKLASTQFFLKKKAGAASKSL
jgi:hypothetical protein